MTGHLDPVDLAELALGGGALDEAPPRVRKHLRACGACRGELDSLRRLVRAVRSATPSDLVGPPPPGVWTRLAREADVGRRAVPEGDGPVRRERPRRPELLLAAAVLAAAAWGGAAVWCRRRRRGAVTTVVPVAR
ncbi:hypothetical protein [Streptomyces sp. NPDC007883]|uniref:hypothetical protein n=1 Tax=Streptomyces sp. NPDC007883 TaxID=3155116 RepID=UPI0033D011DC